MSDFRTQLGSSPVRMPHAVPTEAVAWITCPPHSPRALVAGHALTIGRDAECDLTLVHAEVSRVHARVRSAWRQAVVEDAGSVNGTFLNGSPVAKPQVLRDGDVIEVGPFRLEVRLSPARQERRPNTGEQRTQRFLRAPTAAAFAGDLTGLALPEVLQQIEIGGKTGTLTVAAGSRRGWIAASDGRPVAAELEDKVDADAIRALLGFEGGSFVFSREVAVRESRMSTTFQACLLDHARSCDEARRAPAPRRKTSARHGVVKGRRPRTGSSGRAAKA